MLTLFINSDHGAAGGHEAGGGQRIANARLVVDELGCEIVGVGTINLSPAFTPSPFPINGTPRPATRVWRPLNADGGGNGLDSCCDAGSNDASARWPSRYHFHGPSESPAQLPQLCHRQHQQRQQHNHYRVKFIFLSFSLFSFTQYEKTFFTRLIDNCRPTIRTKYVSLSSCVRGVAFLVL